MQHIKNPLQTSFYDPFEHLLSPLGYKRIHQGWQGVFRHVVLQEMPVELLAGEFSEHMGRPTKELYSMAGLLFTMEFMNWTIEYAALAYMSHLDVQYALNLEPGPQSISERTIERYQQIFRNNDIAKAVQDRVTLALVRRLELDVSKQRLDSTHIFSEMAVFGRTKLMGVAAKRFMVQVCRHNCQVYDALPQALRERYLASTHQLFADTRRDGESQKLLREQVAQDMHWLIERFAGDEQFSKRTTYKQLVTIFEQNCEVLEDKVRVRPKAASHAIQNPSDPDATYDGKKGQGYQVQLSETCSKDNEVQLITSVLPQTAMECDPQAIKPVVEDLEQRGMAPEQWLADTSYGSDDNVESLKDKDIELVSPAGGGKQDREKLNVGDFDVDPETQLVQHCPAGHPPLKSEYKEKTGNTLTHMAAEHCDACPERARCPVRGTGKYRSFRHTAKEYRLEQRRRHEKTDAFRDVYRKRAGIEGTNSAVKRRTGLGRLRVRGRPSVFNAIYLKVAGWNVLRAAASETMRAHVAKTMDKQLGKGLLASALATITVVLACLRAICCVGWPKREHEGLRMFYRQTV